MDNNTTLLLDLDGLADASVERLQDGIRRVHLVTAEESARACPACGVLSAQVKGTATTRPRDLPYGEHGLELVWRKRRWYCREPLCPRKSFTEHVRQLPAGARITQRLRDAAGRRVSDAGSTVIQTARDLHLSWPTVMDAFRAVGNEVAAAALEPVEVLGIDETRRGRTQWRQDPATGRWEPVADQWHTGFVDAAGIQGPARAGRGPRPKRRTRLAVHHAPGMAPTDPLHRIDMSTGYHAAVRTGLPHATVVVDHFHVVQLANKMLTSSAGAPPPPCAAGADEPPTRSGRPGAGSCAPAKTSPTSSSRACGTR